ncbi:MAG: helix-turn-helix domain-containing protein [Ruminococcaceae bacterium]|nr:helix-turn-helix domain-containing protein [Oscillospiraceae bacterium]
MSREVSVFKFEKEKYNVEKWRSRSHFHNFFELYYMIDGECQYFIDNKILNVRSNSMVLIPRGIPHKTDYDCKNVYRMQLFFSSDYINSALLPELYRVFPYNVFEASGEQIEKINQISERIENESKTRDAFSFELTKGYLTELFTIVLRSKLNTEANVHKDGNIIIDDAMKYITENYSEEITLTEISKRCAMSVSRFSRLFKNVTGFGFKEYLNSVRIKQANQYLINTDMSVCEIAYACGFNDSNYFSTSFKRASGMSPLKFRNENKDAFSGERF